MVKGARVLVLGLTFKENCPDLRNTKVVDIVRELDEYNMSVDVYDPWVDNEAAHKEYDIKIINALEDGAYDGVIIAVAHHQFVSLGEQQLRALGKPDHVLYDLKNVLPTAASDLRL